MNKKFVCEASARPKIEKPDFSKTKKEKQELKTLKAAYKNKTVPKH